MTDLIVVPQPNRPSRLKALVFDRVSSPITRRERSRYELSELDVQARAFPYSASKRLQAFSASGSL
jgi:hypothetical protein